MGIDNNLNSLYKSFEGKIDTKDKAKAIIDAIKEDSQLDASEVEFLETHADEIFKEKATEVKSALQKLKTQMTDSNKTISFEVKFNAAVKFPDMKKLSECFTEASKGTTGIDNLPSNKKDAIKDITKSYNASPSQGLNLLKNYMNSKFFTNEDLKLILRDTAVPLELKEDILKSLLDSKPLSAGNLDTALYSLLDIRPENLKTALNRFDSLLRNNSLSVDLKKEIVQFLVKSTPPNKDFITAALSAFSDKRPENLKMLMQQFSSLPSNDFSDLKEKIINHAVETLQNTNLEVGNEAINLIVQTSNTLPADIAKNGRIALINQFMDEKTPKEIKDAMLNTFAKNNYQEDKQLAAPLQKALLQNLKDLTGTSLENAVKMLINIKPPSAEIAKALTDIADKLKPGYSNGLGRTGVILYVRQNNPDNLINIAKKLGDKIDNQSCIALLQAFNEFPPKTPIDNELKNLLLKYAGNSEPEIKLNTLNLLNKLGEKLPDADSLLEKQLNILENETNNINLRNILSKFPPDLLKNKEIGDRVTKVLAKILQNPEKYNDDSLKWAVIDTLKKLNETGTLDAKTIFPGLLKALDDKSTSVRLPIISLLGNSDFIKSIGQESIKEAIPKIISKLDDPDKNVCAEAIKTLGELGVQSAIPKLIEKLNDKNISVCREAITALGKLDVKAAIPELIAKLGNNDLSLVAATTFKLHTRFHRRFYPFINQVCN